MTDTPNFLILGLPVYNYIYKALCTCICHCPNVISLLYAGLKCLHAFLHCLLFTKVLFFNDIFLKTRLLAKDTHTYFIFVNKYVYVSCVHPCNSQFPKSSQIV
jgi:hypothetical protein